MKRVFTFSNNGLQAALALQEFISATWRVNRKYDLAGMPSVDRELKPKYAVRGMRVKKFGSLFVTMN